MMMNFSIIALLAIIGVIVSIAVVIAVIVAIFKKK